MRASLSNLGTRTLEASEIRLKVEGVSNKKGREEINTFWSNTVVCLHAKSSLEKKPHHAGTESRGLEQ